MKDIENKADLEKLIDHFYSKLINVEGVGAFFGSLIPIDWAHHKPIMVGFWEFILFSTPNAYMGNVMNPHLLINEKHQITAEHFDQWLQTFNAAVDELFSGPKAEDIKNAAFNIGATMKYKIKKANAK
ncbi:MAG TPA: group III truncated hemoglobin [Cytophagales bacterium]|nr:group III truncated hemoglobin [Cytophagales bacterium]